MRYTHNQENFLKSDVYTNVCRNRIKDTVRNPGSACFGRENSFCVAMKDQVHHKNLHLWCAGPFAGHVRQGNVAGRPLQASHFDVKMHLQGLPLSPMPPMAETRERKGDEMSERQYRTCVRMSEKEYQQLQSKSRAAGMSMNRWLLTQLRKCPPQSYRKEEMRRLVAELNQSRRIINEIARDFNSGCGREEQLTEVKQQLLDAVQRTRAVREMGYPDAV